MFRFESAQDEKFISKNDLGTSFEPNK